MQSFGVDSLLHGSNEGAAGQGLALCCAFRENGLHVAAISFLTDLG